MSFTKEDSTKTKGIAVILLLFHHLFFTDRGYPIDLLFISQDTLRDLAVAARICVWIFAFISAYGITVQFYRKPENETISCFLKKRWISLMKSYWFVYLLAFLCLLVAGKEPMKTYDNSVWNLLLDAFAWSDFFGTPTLLGTWWYMCFAQMQVLLLPVLILACKKLGGIAIFMLVYIGSQFINSGIVSPSGGDYLMYTYATLFGVLCVQYDVFGKFKKTRGYLSVLRWIGVLCVVVLGIWLRFVVVSEEFAYNARQINRVTYAVSAVGVAVLVFLLRGKCKSVGGVLSFLGVHSGNTFLVHMLLVKYFGKIVYGTKNILCTIIILLLASCLLSLLIEWLKKLIRYNQWFNYMKSKPINQTTELDSMR